MDNLAYFATFKRVDKTKQWNYFAIKSKKNGVSKVSKDGSVR